ncbi:MAG: 1-deoxy-D-xylulose-5-phosphate synthase, partial [Planctomycetes bacterium]|nr:1-deoxy-D-xylulose-5-phosphate synthase [Planctomycetota bacterium]
MKPLPLLDSLLSPADLRRFSKEQLAQIAEEIRYRIKETVSEHGGHLSSNLGVVELTLALHRTFDFSSDRLLWDVGHQAYVHKLITGRAAVFHTNRQLGGISGFPDPKESPFDIAKVGHSSTAISTGVGVSEGYRKLGQHRKTVVVVGDGALTGGMAFEGLINAGELKSDLLVVLNDNGNFIDAPVGSLHTHLDRIRTGRLYNHLRQRMARILKKMPYGQNLEHLAENLELAAHKFISPGYIFEDLGFRYFGPVDGHDAAAIEEALGRVALLKEPVLLHVLTKKGGGWQPSVDDPLKFHGPKGFDLDTGLFIPKPAGGKTYSQVFADSLIELAREDDRVVGITAAMPSGTCLREFGKIFPDRMYDVGICEQHSFGFAEGLAASGMRPVVAHYSTFAQRGFDQLFQEVVVQRNLGIIITLDRAGMVGEDGETHQGLYDIAWSRTLPGLVLMAPKDGGELRAMLRWAHAERCRPDVRAAGYCLRYPREEVPAIAWTTAPEQPVVRGKAEVLTRATLAPGGQSPLMIWAYGAMVRIAWNALASLGADAAGVTLVNARFAKPLDTQLLAELAASHAQLLTLEDHALMGGFGAAVAESVVDQGLTIKMTRGGVRDELVPHAGRDQQLAAHGLDQAGVTRRISEMLGIGGSQAIRFPRTG